MHIWQLDIMRCLCDISIKFTRKKGSSVILPAQQITALISEGPHHTSATALQCNSWYEQAFICTALWGIYMYLRMFLCICSVEKCSLNYAYKITCILKCQCSWSAVKNASTCIWCAWAWFTPWITKECAVWFTCGPGAVQFQPIHWHPLQVATALRFECSAASMHGTQISRSTVWCNLVLKELNNINKDNWERVIDIMYLSNFIDQHRLEAEW